MRLRLGLLAVLLFSVFASLPALASDDFPQRPLKIIVPFPPGAGPDNVARLVAQHLQDAFGQTVLVENRAGALGSIGALEVARSAPDGYTLLMGTNTTHASNVATFKNLPYDPVKDFAPVIRTTTTAMVLLVNPKFEARDLPQFLDYAKASGASQISIAQLQSRGGLSVVAASYRGVPQAMTDVMAGVIDLTFGDFSVAIPQMQGGTLRGIGVTSAARNELTPGLPALSEALSGFEATIWYGLFAPAGTPAFVVDKIYAECAKYLAMPETKAKLADVGVIVAPLAPAEFGAFVKAEVVRWSAEVKAAGIEPQ